MYFHLLYWNMLFHLCATTIFGEAYFNDERTIIVNHHWIGCFAKCVFATSICSRIHKGLERWLKFRLQSKILIMVNVTKMRESIKDTYLSTRSKPLNWWWDFTIALKWKVEAKQGFDFMYYTQEIFVDLRIYNLCIGRLMDRIWPWSPKSIYHMNWNISRIM